MTVSHQVLRLLMDGKDKARSRELRSDRHSALQYFIKLYYTVHSLSTHTIEQLITKLFSAVPIIFAQFPPNFGSAFVHWQSVIARPYGASLAFVADWDPDKFYKDNVALYRPPALLSIATNKCSNMTTLQNSTIPLPIRFPLFIWRCTRACRRFPLTSSFPKTYFIWQHFSTIWSWALFPEEHGYKHMAPVSVQTVARAMMETAARSSGPRGGRPMPAETPYVNARSWNMYLLFHWFRIDDWGMFTAALLIVFTFSVVLTIVSLILYQFEQDILRNRNALGVRQRLLGGISFMFRMSLIYLAILIVSIRNVWMLAVLLLGHFIGWIIFLSDNRLSTEFGASSSSTHTDKNDNTTDDNSSVSSK